jgi:hypothetical protein
MPWGQLGFRNCYCPEGRINRNRNYVQSTHAVLRVRCDVFLFFFFLNEIRFENFAGSEK